MIYEKTDNFFVQKIYMTNISQDRFDYFSDICRDKKVLHVGCADSMFYDKSTNLHVKLKSVASELHGLDNDEESLKSLIEDCPGEYFNSFNHLDEYDVVLVPETLEHIRNQESFLSNLFNVSFKEIILTVPNIVHYGKEIIQTDDSSIEINHPDHKSWHSPYTLYNTLKPWINENNCEMIYLEGKSMIGARITC